MSAPKRIREIIGLLGHQGVGKNYIAEKILPEILINSRNTVVLAFADHLKIECISKLGADFDKVYGEKDYETRKLLQITGTEEGELPQITHIHVLLEELGRRRRRSHAVEHRGGRA